MTDYAQALDACRNIGLLVDALEIDGRWHRCPVEGKKKSNRAGAYYLTEFVSRKGLRLIVGVAHNWVNGAQHKFNGSSAAVMLSAEESETLRKELEKARRESDRQRKVLAEETAARAQGIWEKLPVEGSSAYLQRKKVYAYGLRFSRGSIVVPVGDVAGKLWGLQFIDTAGNKKFLTGTAKKGRFHLLGDVETSDKILIAEGYATAASLHRALGFAVACAFDAGNLAPVAQALQGVYPDKPIVVCADNDRETKGNPGVDKARQAAKKTGGWVVVPQFEKLLHTDGDR